MQLKGFMFAIISAIFFGTAGIFVKHGYTNNFGPVDLLMLQYIIAGVILLIMCLVFHPKALKLSFTSLKKLLVQGVIGNTLMTVFFYSAFKYLEVSVTTMLLYTYPAMVSLFSLAYYKEKITRLKAIAIGGTFIGCILVLNITGETIKSLSLTGVAFGLLSALFYSFMNIYAKRIVEDSPPLVITFYTTIFSLIILLIFNYDFLVKLPAVSYDSIKNAGYLAFFCEIVPLTLLYSAIKHIGPVTTSIISTLELPAAALFSFTIMGETLSLLQVSGIILVLLSIIILKKEH